MKRLLTFLLFTVILLSSTLYAQIPPNAFNYSAVARGPQGQPISSQNIGIRFSILKTTATGPVQYVESHQTTTDPFGLFNLIIGGGSVESGDFASIDWGADDYFLKVELDAQGNINYFHMGTIQFLSVPYALYAGNSTYAQNGIDSVSSSGDTLYLSNGDVFVNSATFSGNYDDLTNLPTTVDSISSTGDTLYLSNGDVFVNSTSFSGNYNDLTNQPTTVDSISSTGDTLYLSNGDVFVNSESFSGDYNDLTNIPTTIDSLSLNNDTIYFSDGTIFQSGTNQISSNEVCLNGVSSSVSGLGDLMFCASYCRDLVEGGYSDWRLPTIQEILHYRTEMELNNITWFNGYLWSTSYDSTGSQFHYFNEVTGEIYQDPPNLGNFQCRCVR